jgi:membrane associated rhomboid family serine protease
VNPFRQILDDTAHLLGDIRRGLQHLRWRLSWRRRLRQADSERRQAEAENVRRGIAATTKMCRGCRALIPASAAVCPECGAGTADIRSGGMGRRLAHVFPFEMSVSMLLVTVYFGLFLAGFLISARLDPRPGDGDRGPIGSLLSLDGRALVVLGANVGELSGGPEPWRLLTGTFLHAGILHILFNTWALRVVGVLVENIYGGSRLFVLCLITGVSGNVVSLWWHGEDWFQVGASGAIFGLIGVAAVYGFRRRDALGEALRRHMTEWAVYGLVMGFLMPVADNAAHIGGLLSGALAAYVLPDPQRVTSAASAWLWAALAWLGAAATFLAFALIAYRWAGAA